MNDAVPEMAARQTAAPEENTRDARRRPEALCRRPEALCRRPAALALLAWLAFSCTVPAIGRAQAPPIPDDDAEIRELATPEPAEAPAEAADAPSGIDLITLIGRGGAFMWPIGIMSVLVVTLAVERLVSFRRRRMLPRQLVRRLHQLMRGGGESFDPEEAFEACQQHRSAAARVIAAMLMRTGRPLAEIEQAGSDTAQREADEHAGPIRWLHLAAAATPLMGLLGTVWGMIRAFHDSSILVIERSRSEQLSEGIYIALVTTLAGLAVAIPAAIMAQYLENRLAKTFHRIEELAFTIAPALEPFTGRMRLDADARLRPIHHDAPPQSPGVHAAPPTTPRSDLEKRPGGGVTAASNR